MVLPNVNAIFSYKESKLCIDLITTNYIDSVKKKGIQSFDFPKNLIKITYAKSSKIGQFL